MQQKSIINYFLSGFSLANRSLDIFLISLLFSLPTFLSTYIQNSPLAYVPQLLNVILAFISIGFMLSLPVFLVQKQQKKALEYRYIAKVTLKNTKRIILPVFIFFVLSVVILISSFILVAIILQPNKDQIIMFLQNIVKGWQPISLIPIILLAFLQFTSFFFSLEGIGLLSSIRKSIVATFNNLYYISIVILIGIISYTLTSSIPIETFLGQVVITVLGGYIALVLTASSLFYYQAVIKGSLKTPGKRKYSLGIIFAIAFLLLIGAVYLNSYFKTTKTLPNTYSEQQSQSKQWSSYQSGSQISNYGFSFTFPQGWKVNTQEQGKLSDNVGYRINFDLSPQDWTVDNSANGWLGWGVMSADVYPPKPDINQWLSAFLPDYKDYLTYNVEQIGNKESYSLYPRPDAPDSKKEFSGRSVVLGRNYSYVIGFGSNRGRDDFPDLVKKEIFPGLKFE